MAPQSFKTIYVYFQCSYCGPNGDAKNIVGHAILWSQCSKPLHLQKGPKI